MIVVVMSCVVRVGRVCKEKLFALWCWCVLVLECTARNAMGRREIVFGYLPVLIPSLRFPVGRPKEVFPGKSHLSLRTVLCLSQFLKWKSSGCV